MEHCGRPSSDADPTTATAAVTQPTEPGNRTVLTDPWPAASVLVTLRNHVDRRVPLATPRTEPDQRPSPNGRWQLDSMSVTAAGHN